MGSPKITPFKGVASPTNIASKGSNIIPSLLKRKETLLDLSSFSFKEKDQLSDSKPTQINHKHQNPYKKVSKVKHSSPKNNDSIPQDIPVLSKKNYHESIPNSCPFLDEAQPDNSANTIPIKDLTIPGLKVNYSLFKTPQDSNNSKGKGINDSSKYATHSESASIKHQNKEATIDTKSVSNNLSGEFNKSYFEALTYNLPKDDLSGIPPSELGPFFKKNEKKKLNMTFEANQQF